jgi:glycerate dehydrogenase
LNRTRIRLRAGARAHRGKAKMVKIVVLDGAGVNPGDLSWEPLSEAGDLTVYPRTEPGETVERAASAHIILTESAPLTQEMIAQLPKLRCIMVMATGYDHVDSRAASLRNIPVCNVPGYGTEAVAQMAVSHMFNLARRISDYSASVSQGNWDAAPSRGEIPPVQTELSGLTLGIVGFGSIGRRTAEIASCLGMHILAWSRTRSAAPLPGSFSWTGLDDLLRRSDIISLHVPLTKETAGMINSRSLSLMKPSAYLVNTARGGLIVEEDLAEALSQGALAGAGLDVLTCEPPSADNPLLGAPNCYITPHIAWVTRAARGRLIARIAENVKAFISEKPIPVVHTGGTSP